MISEFTDDINVISKLSDLPNEQDLLTSEQLKQKFDMAGATIKNYINNTLVTQINNDVHIRASERNISYYVNYKTGDDNNDGQSDAGALKTIQTAIDRLPKIIDHTVNVYVTATDEEEYKYIPKITISGFSGNGKINITKNPSASTATYYYINGVTIDFCSIKEITMSFIGIKDNMISVSGCDRVSISNCKFENSTSGTCLSSANGSFVKLESSSFACEKAIGLNAYDNGDIYAYGLTVTSIGTMAKAMSGGRIYMPAITGLASSKYSVLLGGTIFKNVGTIIE